MSTDLIIRFADTFNLEFAIEPSPIANLWMEKMSKRHSWLMDDDRRFYNFDSPEQNRAKAKDYLKTCIETINSYQPIIQKEFTSIDDQDFLNYLHNIFEQYHGLLDQQNTDWWKSAPDAVKKALAELNIAVHRAETAHRSSGPRFVCTWFGMPKDSTLDPELIKKYGRFTNEFGGVYLNYVEIGKTLEDLSLDDDQYISDDAFQPFRHYSADFNVRFYDEIVDIARAYRYFEKHRDFFEVRGILDWEDYRVVPCRYKVARLKSDLNRDEILAMVAQHQHVTDIYIE